MGLDCSHDAFHGAYSAFNRFRKAVCEATGGSFPPHESATHSDGTVLEAGFWYWGEGYSEDTHPGLYALLIHSDCDGDIDPKTCALLAEELDALLPRMTEKYGGGHIAARGGMLAVARNFIAGCRAAALADEPLRFC